MPSESNDNRFLAAVQYVVLWISLFVMLAFFILMFRADFKVPQKNMSFKIDIKNKINICLPEDSESPKNR